MMIERCEDKHLLKLRDVVLPDRVALFKQLLHYFTANKPRYTSDRDNLGCVYRSHCAQKYDTQCKQHRNQGYNVYCDALKRQA